MYFNNLIEWVGKKGYTMVLSSHEINQLRTALNVARREFFSEPFEDLEISYSPILDEEAK